MIAPVIPIRPNRRYCTQCANGFSNADGIYCAVFREFIRNEAYATDCPEFDPSEEPLSNARQAAKKRHPTNYLQVVPSPLEPVLTQITVSSPPQPRWAPTHEQAVEYIRSLHTTLWGMQVLVAKEDDRDRAADWIVKLFADVQAFADA